MTDSPTPAPMSDDQLANAEAWQLDLGRRQVIDPTAAAMLLGDSRKLLAEVRRLRAQQTAASGLRPVSETLLMQLRGALGTVRKVSEEARLAWDQDMRAGKLLIAMVDPSLKYRSDITATHRAEAELAALLATPLPGRPDHCYVTGDWEFTQAWADRYELLDSADRGEVIELSTLYEGPSAWICEVPIAWGEDGTPDEWERRTFWSEAEAIAAAKAEKPATSSAGAEA